MKRKGDKGQPCINPLPLWKKCVLSPVINTTKEVELEKLIIQFVIKCPKLD
jgi:hypothetical protein